MSPILDLQRRMREIGRIRLGKQVPTSSGKMRPASLDTFRFTSKDRAVLEAMAVTVGGTVSSWDAEGRGEWELISVASEINVQVPPMDEPYTQWYELWTAAGCQRRCDSEKVEVAVKRGEELVMETQDCLCEPDNRECQRTTRVSFLLPWAPGIGRWRLDSKGYNTGVELTGALDYLSRLAVQGIYLNCRLRIERRSKRVPGKAPMDFVVPVLDTDSTLDSLTRGMGMPALPVTTDAPLDVEDVVIVEKKAPKRTRAPKPPMPAAPPPPSGDEAAFAPEEPEQKGLSDDQRRKLFGKGRDLFGADAEDKVREATFNITGSDSTKDIPPDEFDVVVAELHRLNYDYKEDD